MCGRGTLPPAHKTETVAQDGGLGLDLGMVGVVPEDAGSGHDRLKNSSSGHNGGSTGWHPHKSVLLVQRSQFPVSRCRAAPEPQFVRYACTPQGKNLRQGGVSVCTAVP